MRKNILLTGLATCILLSGISQNAIVLKITHKLNGADFDFNQECDSPEDEPFELDRMEYYLSEFSVTHDGGTVTEFDSLWALVQAEDGYTSISLGNANIQDVESVSFSVGVDQAHNHLDMTSYPASHPLGPKNPSMHWGWTAGYRFVAMEGVETDGSEVFEIHALGDNNYFETTVDVVVSEDNGNVIIPIFANYSEALNGIELANGVITHGDFGEAVDLLENFRDYVFSSVEPVDSIPDDTASGIMDDPALSAFGIVPNPAHNGSIQVTLGEEVTPGQHILIYDLTGKYVRTETITVSIVNVQILNVKPGAYFVELRSANGQRVQVSKAIVLD